LCKEANQTRWFSYSRVALWIITYHESLCKHILANISSDGEISGLSDSWAKFFQWLMKETFMAQTFAVAEYGEIFLEHAFLWGDDGAGDRCFVIHDFLLDWKAQLRAIQADTETYFTVTYAFCLENNIDAKSLICRMVSRFTDYTLRRVSFWFNPPYMFARLKKGDAIIVELAKKIMATKQELEGSDAFHEEGWDGLGFLTDEDTVSDIESMAETTELPDRLSQKINVFFGVVPVHNAKMENVFRYIRDLPLANYTVEGLTSTTRAAMCDTYSPYWCHSDRDLFQQRKKDKALLKERELSMPPKARTSLEQK
jgi:hypothetical protein